MAASAAGIQPITSQESLSHDLATNASLHRAFHHEVRSEVRKILRDDKDLVPNKYKNTEKYFGNKK
jgi:hypothetical protein